MTINYSEITIIKNIDSFLQTAARCLDLETSCYDSDIIIIQFNDIIVDINHEHIDNEHFKFSESYNLLGIRYVILNQFYFKGNLIKRRRPKIIDSRRIMDTHIIRNEDKYNVYKLGSMYNMVFEDINKQEVFTIIKLQSNNIKPRFMLAYDDDVFDKSDVIYLVEKIFKQSFV